MGAAALRRGTRPARVAVAGLLAAAASALLSPTPAAAHTADPRIVTVVDAVEPPLPAGVVVQVQQGVATQLVVANPTADPLTVLARGGEPFLRVMSSGVEANLDSPEFYETSNPIGSSSATPPEVAAGRGDGPPRFVRIGTSPSWGWYDHRLHPVQLVAPRDSTRPARLADFTIPLLYRDQPVTVRGHVEFRPLKGAFRVTADPVPEALRGVTVQVLQSDKLPGIFLRSGSATPFTVLGRDGEPFARSGQAGLEVNVVSRTWVEDQQARGRQPATPAATPRFEARPGTSLTWLDPRLRWSSAAPTEAALRSSEPSTLGRWEVPVEVDGRRVALTGEIRWIPTGAPVVERGDGASRLPLLIGGAVAVLVLVSTVLSVRRRRT